MSSIKAIENISQWSAGYFRINQKGNLEVVQGSYAVELLSIVDDAAQAGLQLPLLMRFPFILHDRITQLYAAFTAAIAENDYGNTYKLAYPIKVNQQHYVLHEILQAPESVGLEAGSKAELIAALGMLGVQNTTIICNGYKDSSYIRLALIAQKMGHEVYIIIEELDEVDLILRQANLMQIVPRLGIRIKISSKLEGMWEDSGGSAAKFGLSAEQVLCVLEKLSQNDFGDTVNLMHCHLGSQATNIRGIRDAMLEVARFYVELTRLGYKIETVDVGGGLGVDYEGTQSNTSCSINYTLEEYAMNILIPLKQLCDEAQISPPRVITESGRGITAHHAIVITNLNDVEKAGEVDSVPPVAQEVSYVVHDLIDTFKTFKNNTPCEVYNYAVNALNTAEGMFKHGALELQELVLAQKIYRLICSKVCHMLDLDNPSELEVYEQITEQFAAKLFMNLSIFQSLPDTWAIDQVFPVMPISQLDKPLTMHGVLHDITCDSHGKIDTVMLWPEYDRERPYNVGFFLVGAYQEILGNLHNLFGDTNSLDVLIHGDSEFEITNLVTGDTIGNVLQYANYDSKKVLQACEKQLRRTNIKEEDREQYLNEIRCAFTQLTYLELKRSSRRERGNNGDT